LKWLDGDEAQNLRKGQTMPADGNEAEMVPSEKLIETPTMGESNTEGKRKMSGESCLPLKKRMIASHSSNSSNTLPASLTDSCPSTPLLSSSCSVTSSPTEEKMKSDCVPVHESPSPKSLSEMSAADVFLLLSKESKSYKLIFYSLDITITVQSKSGKLIAKNLCISAIYTFDELIALLPLPAIDAGSGEMYVCSKPMMEGTTSPIIFLNQDRLGLYLHSGDTLIISKSEQIIPLKQDFK
jgi:hypothetical protein